MELERQGVSLPLLSAVIQALVRVHGNRVVPWEGIEAIRARLASIEAIYLESPLAPRKQRKSRNRDVSGGGGDG